MASDSLIPPGDNVSLFYEGVVLWNPNLLKTTSVGISTVHVPGPLFYSRGLSNAIRTVLFLCWLISLVSAFLSCWPGNCLISCDLFDALKKTEQVLGLAILVIFSGRVI